MKKCIDVKWGRPSAKENILLANFQCCEFIISRPCFRNVWRKCMQRWGMHHVYLMKMSRLSRVRERISFACVTHWTWRMGRERHAGEKNVEIHENKLACWVQSVRFTLRITGRSIVSIESFNINIILPITCSLVDSLSIRQIRNFIFSTIFSMIKMTTTTLMTSQSKAKLLNKGKKIFNEFRHWVYAPWKSLLISMLTRNFIWKALTFSNHSMCNTPGTTNSAFLI